MKHKVLIVDDEPDIVRLLAKFLMAAGYETESAENGFEAFKKIQTWHPDLVISDVQMPVWDGFKLLKAVQESAEFSETPIMIISGYVGESAFELNHSPNFAGFIPKPCSTRKIVDSVNSYFDAHPVGP